MYTAKRDLVISEIPSMVDAPNSPNIAVRKQKYLWWNLNSGCAKLPNIPKQELDIHSEVCLTEKKKYCQKKITHEMPLQR
jgi:hypothetical protein